MRETDLPTLKARIEDVLRASALYRYVEDVQLEADRDESGADFLRIVVSIRPGEDVSDDDLEAVLTSIEDAVSLIDERFPSVRFADAA